MEHVIGRVEGKPAGRAYSLSKTQEKAVQDRSSSEFRWVVNPERVATWLFAVTAGIVLASLSVSVAEHFAGYDSRAITRLSKVFSVDRELNIPAFFSMLLLLSSAVLLGLITLMNAQRRAAYRWHWAILFLGFLYMSFDEIAEVHEKLIEPMRAVLGNRDLGIFYYAWVVPAIALVGILALLFLRFWWNLNSRTRLLFFIAGSLYLGGAVGVELFNGQYAETYGRDQLLYHITSATEEALEMSGTIVFIYALLEYLSRHARRLAFEIGEPRIDDAGAGADAASASIAR